ncbi:MAG: hypothetical protein M3Z09_15175 [Acidobacteriota bacterium]|nr:hypothetical protein [Acidobacteriota bacterium]
MLRAVLLLVTTALLNGQQTQIGTAPSYTPVPRPFLKSQGLAGGTVAVDSWIDTSSRTGVASSYLNTFLPSSFVLPGWIGNTGTGDAGSTTQAYRDAVLLRINWFRQMGGVPTPIAFSTSFNSGDQQAALMMSVNGQLNHSPPSSWTYFTAAGADAAARSNLCLEIPYLSDPGCVAQYMQDYGANNPEVGHRRWLLYPQTRDMGTGDVQPPYPLAFANALWVLDSHYYDARPLTRDGFVAWPPKGYVPYQIVPGRWSFSYPGADFTNAIVTMQRNGGPVSVRQETPQQGYGENTVVWIPDNIDPSVSTRWPAPAADTPITVTVSRVLVSGVDTTFNYAVTVFDPVEGFNISGHIVTGGSALGGVTVTLNGGLAAVTDATGAYVFGALPGGTYLGTPSLPGFAFSPPSRSVAATAANVDFTAVACDYSGIGGNFSAAARSGTGIYTYPLAPGCTWTVTSSVPWLTVDPSTTSGTGPITINYRFTTNYGTARTAVLTLNAAASLIAAPVIQ